MQRAGQDAKVGGIQACLRHTLQRDRGLHPPSVAAREAMDGSRLIKDQHSNMLCRQAKPQLCALF